jgi:hypothetical protein
MKFDSRLMTNALLAWILALLMYHFERGMFWNVVLGIGCMWAAILAIQYPAKFKAARAKAKQEKADEDEYWNVYQPAWEAVRHKYDPKKEWNEISTVPQAYRDELREVNRKHRRMLKRRNNMDVE